MKRPPSSVLDASALLAYLEGERGASVVAAALKRRAVICAVNWAEVLAKLSDRGMEPEEFANQLRARGMLGQKLAVQPVDDEIALESARLRPLTSSAGLSVGDRLCLATGIRLKLPVLTADHAWDKLKVSARIVLIR